MLGPIAVLPLCPVACASMLARVGDDLWAVVIVKATFALAHEHGAWPVQSAPIEELDEQRGERLLRASEIVPYLPGCGVHVAEAMRQTYAAARVAIFSGQASLLDKRRAPEDGPTFAPRAASERRARLPRSTASTLPFEVSRDFDWAALHVAPLDQRLAQPLRGDEWLVLDGFRSDLPRVQTQLPFVRAEARYARTDRPGTLTPVALAADTLALEPDALLASVVWRGHILVGSPDEASTLRVFVGIEVPTLPIRWPAPALPAERRAEASATASIVEDPPSGPTEPWPEIPDTTSERDVRAIRAMLADKPPLATRTLLSAPTSEVDASMLVRPTLPFEPHALIAVERRDENLQPRMPTETAEIDVHTLNVRSPFAPQTARDPDRLDGTAEVDAREIESASLPFSIGPSAVLGAALQPAALTESKATSSDLALTAEARALLDRHRSGSARGVRFPGASLAGLDLRGIDLGDADLSGAVLRGANLTDARLVGAKLIGADLSGVRLDGADLSRADLTRAMLAGAVLDGARLGDARMVRADAKGVSLRGARGARANFSRGVWEGANFEGAELEQPDLSSSFLTNATFAHARLDGATLAGARGERASFERARLTTMNASGAELSGCSFAYVEAQHSIWDGARLQGCSFDGAELSEARFLRAALASASFVDAKLRRADMQRIEAPGIDLSRANLRSAEMQQARLAGATLDDATAIDAQMAGVDLTGARARRADLTGATLREAKLAGADLSDARLSGVDLRNANLSGALVTAASLEQAKLAGAQLEGIRRLAPNRGATKS